MADESRGKSRRDGFIVSGSLVNVFRRHFSLQKWRRIVNHVVLCYTILQWKTSNNRRVLFTQNRLPPEVVQNIKHEIAIELGLKQNTVQEADRQEEDHEPTRVLIEVDVDVENIFYTNTIIFEGLDPTTRPRLPRLRFQKNIRKIIGEVNKILEQKLDACRTLIELHQLLYVEAATVLVSNKQELQTRQAQMSMQTGESMKPWQIGINNKIQNR